MEDNPYRAPEFADPLTIGAPPSASEKEIRAFVGRNASYYLRKWPGGIDDSGRARGFNWAAFLLSGLWLPFRKMYRITVIVFGIFAVETILEEIAVAAGVASEQGLSAVGSLLGLVFSIICGMFGNAWYLAHAKREIARIRELGLDDDAYYEALARRGGTSLLASLGLFCLFLGLMFTLGLAFEFLFSGE